MARGCVTRTGALRLFWRPTRGKKYGLYYAQYEQTYTVRCKYVMQNFTNQHLFHKALLWHFQNYSILFLFFFFFKMLVESESRSRSVVSKSLQSMELSRPEYCRGQLFPSLGIFPTQGSNPGLPHCMWSIYRRSHQDSPRILEWVACPFSRGSSWPRTWTRVSCIAGGFFTRSH